MLSKRRTEARRAADGTRAEDTRPGPARELARLQQLERDYALLNENTTSQEKSSGSVPHEAGLLRVHRGATRAVPRDRPSANGTA
jgi:hypothetical protein